MSELPVGRELDAAVAEKVMGWKPWQSKHGYWQVDTPTGSYNNFGEHHWMKYDPETGKKLDQPKWWEYIHELPSYSTDIAAAWQVVEKMVSMQEANVYAMKGLRRWDGPIYKDSGHYLTNEGYPLGTTCWYVIFEADGNRKTVCAPTAPEAICRAALAAMEAGRARE